MQRVVVLVIAPVYRYHQLFPALVSQSHFSSLQTTHHRRTVVGNHDRILEHGTPFGGDVYLVGRVIGGEVIGSEEEVD